MKPVYQTIIDKNKGNCMQAMYASLFELELEEVPNFSLWWNENPPDDRHWSQVEWDFIKKQGYSEGRTLYNPNCRPNGISQRDKNKVLKEYCLEAVKEHNGVKGCFYASVLSPIFYKNDGGTHCILVDNNFNIVHDPNPEYRGLTEYPLSEKNGYKGILYIKTYVKEK